MADIDEVDRHMGRAKPPTPEEVLTDPHPYQPGLKGCVACGQTAIHYNHRTENNPESLETIAEEASRIVYGDREKAYDDPNRNFRKIAYMINGVLDEKLKVSGSITSNDVALILECLKISRESFKPNRENRVDGIGYWLCLDRIVAEQEKQKDE